MGKCVHVYVGGGGGGNFGRGGGGVERVDNWGVRLACTQKQRSPEVGIGPAPYINYACILRLKLFS